jgi:M6 family metalloprotease-like protein
MKPGEANHGQTINGYWMEQSRGRFGITEVEVFGPYRMPKPIWAYGLNEYGQNDRTHREIIARVTKNIFFISHFFLLTSRRLC